MHPDYTGPVTQYDTIALDYQKISAAVPLRDAEWHSLHQRLGGLTALSVLDLACGDGMGTRLLKRWGAGAEPTRPRESREPDTAGEARAHRMCGIFWTYAPGRHPLRTAVHFGYQPPAEPTPATLWRGAQNPPYTGLARHRKRIQRNANVRATCRPS